MDNKKKRQTNIEVLRVMAMLFIVIGHYIYWGINSNPNGGHFNSYFDWCSMELVRIITLTAVDLYVFITGYFLIEKTTFRWKGIFRTWGIAFFYSVVIWLTVLMIGRKEFSLQDCMAALMPLTVAKYWFIQMYLGLLLLAPFLSVVALHITKKQYLLLLGIMFFLNFDIPFREPFNSGNVCSLSWFCFLYLCAGYYRLYGIPKWIEKYIISINVVLTLGLLIAFFGVNFYKHNADITHYKLYGTGPDGLIVFLAMAQFVLFSRLKCHGNTWDCIASIAPSTFGVYLIHENRNITDLIWWDIMPQSRFWENYQVVHCLLFSVVLYLACIMIDFVRSYIGILLRNIVNKR